jgi:TonB-dependent starch-binding outer membrane protein SusC
VAPSFCPINKTKTFKIMKNKPKPIGNALLFFMKITLIQMLMTCLSVMIGYAIDTSGQEVLERKITLQTQNAEVKNILIEIEKKSDVKFTYRPRLIKDLDRVTLNLVETPLADVLSQVLGTKLGYDVIGKQIVLKEVKKWQQEQTSERSHRQYLEE